MTTQKNDNAPFFAWLLAGAVLVAICLAVPPTACRGRGVPVPQQFNPVIGELELPAVFP